MKGLSYLFGAIFASAIVAKLYGNPLGLALLNLLLGVGLYLRAIAGALGRIEKTLAEEKALLAKILRGYL